MISPWEIYLVLQLDKIGQGATAFSAAAVVATLLAAVFYCTTSPEGYDARLHGTAKTALKWALPASLVFSLAAVTIPSSKTAAAMIIIPAIANNETIQKEAADLYGLAKQALTEAIKPDDEPKK